MSGERGAIRVRIAYVGLGSNLGEREQFLQHAVQRISQLPNVQIEAHSSIYHTEPVGYVEQPIFLNMVIRIRTTMEPEPLLASLLEIELELGRTREIHWGPRTIDLDLLWMEHTTHSSQILTLPHPYMLERAFVLVPLLECCHPTHLQLKQQAERHLSNLPDQGEVKLWTNPNWRAAFVPFVN